MSGTPISVAAGRVLSRPLLVGVLVLGAAAADRLADPVHNHVPLCPFRALTGLWCPLCGGLRSAYSLTRLDVVAAVRDNALLVIALPVLLAYWVDWVRRDRRGLPERRLGRGAIAGLWVVAAVLTVLRNLPAADWLRPTA
jgi:hypothetical protein